MEEVQFSTKIEGGEPNTRLTYNDHFFVNWNRRRLVRRFRFVDVQIPDFSPLRENIESSFEWTTIGPGYSREYLADPTGPPVRWADLIESWGDGIAYASEEEITEFASNRGEVVYDGETLDTYGDFNKFIFWKNKTGLLGSRAEPARNVYLYKPETDIGLQFQGGMLAYPARNSLFTGYKLIVRETLTFFYDNNVHRAGWVRMPSSASEFVFAAERNNSVNLEIEHDSGTETSSIQKMLFATISSFSEDYNNATTAEEFLTELNETVLPEGMDASLDEEGFLEIDGGNWADNNGHTFAYPKLRERTQFGQASFIYGIPYYSWTWGGTPATSRVIRGQTSFVENWGEMCQLVLLSSAISPIVNRVGDNSPAFTSAGDMASSSKYSLGEISSGDNEWIDLGRPTDLDLIDFTFVMRHGPLDLQGRAITGKIQFE